MLASNAVFFGNAPLKIIASVPGLMAEQRLVISTSPSPGAANVTSLHSTRRSATWKSAWARIAG